MARIGDQQLPALREVWTLGTKLDIVLPHRAQGNTAGKGAKPTKAVKKTNPKE